MIKHDSTKGIEICFRTFTRRADVLRSQISELVKSNIWPKPLKIEINTGKLRKNDQTRNSLLSSSPNFRVPDIFNMKVIADYERVLTVNFKAECIIGVRI